MSIEQLGSIGEFIAAIAVLFSLLYVGVQIRAHRIEMRRSAFGVPSHQIRNWHCFGPGTSESVKVPSPRESLHDWKRYIQCSS
jgi:hypothetical protein